MPQLSLHTPLGALTISAEDDAVVALDWGWGRDQTPTALLRDACDQLHAYLDGERTAFDLPPIGGASRQAPRSTPPTHAVVGPPSATGSSPGTRRMGPPAAPARAPAAPASIFGGGADSAERSLDEVILAYLAEDLPEK